MTKKKSKRRSQALFASLEKITSPAGTGATLASTGVSPAATGAAVDDGDAEAGTEEAGYLPGRPPGDAEDQPLDLDSLADQPICMAPDSSRSLRMKKFRTQLLHQWLAANFAPCRALDIGGGKGLLAHLLIQGGWQAAVVDPVSQALPDKYKDIRSNARVKIAPGETVPRIDAAFAVELAQDYDLLLGMHAHGSNAKIIDAASLYGCGFVIFPCCVIDEPFFPRLGVHWIEALASYAVFKGLAVFPFRINFKGQNIGLCHVGARTHFLANRSDEKMI